MTDAVFEEIAEYQPFDAPGPRQAVFEHSLRHVRAIVGTIETWTLPSTAELAFVRDRASLRATQQMPLSALLHAYRIGHRKVWQRLVQLLEGSEQVLEASLGLTALTLAYTELISTVLADCYTERQRHLLLEVDRDRRELLDRILRGAFDRESDLELASSFAMTPGGDYLVIALTRSPGDAAPTGESLTRGAETLKRHLALGVAQPFVVVRHDEIISISPLARARAASLAHLTRQAVMDLQRGGESWTGGLSTICNGLGEVARGYHEARQAATLATPESPVCGLLDLRVQEYLVARADETVLRMIPPAARRVLESTEADNRLLVHTLRTYAEADLSLAVAADRLDVHPNTVSYRLRKLGQRLDCDLTKFSDLLEVLTWARVLRL